MYKGNDRRLLVTSVQRFCLHDGPGIRTTAFLKGCPLRCPWCSNPENIHPVPEPYSRGNESGTYGRWVLPGDLAEELLRDRPFYLGGGGVTYSGGEPLLQAGALAKVAREVKAAGVHQAVETSLAVSRGNLEELVDIIDLFLVDVKVLDTDGFRNTLGGELGLYLSNLEFLRSCTDQVLLRIPLIGGYTDTECNLSAVASLAKTIRPLAVEAMVGHALGASKYESLGLEPLKVREPDMRSVEAFVQELERDGISVSLLKI